ncbi:NEW3 domain-containing protein [Amycolatopsis australiensis]|uniref:Ig-like domain (Group 2) n=1 Tax=Amycolatopsis australiensis TaxID=546364 RepID=A0A1K1S3Q8_9PSEU|nr:NEW3 domain-containing protein [Amycolatopsis australiensis]SFW78724.1 Ig-like domain (group 2) [Amycolatopsis australiensis]
MTVHVDVTNTGRTPGATVAQLYAATAFGVPGVELPRQRLAGFRKTDVLAPGRTQHLAIPVRIADLALWDEGKQREVVYDGPYRFGVGADAGHLAGAATVAVTGARAPKTRYVTVQPGQVVFAPGQSLDLTGRNPWIADDTAQAARHVPADHVVEAVRDDQSFADLAHARIGYHSSNPRVAQVSRTGRVTLIAPGVATIGVTVDGVTGSTPVVVKQPFTLTAPAQVAPGTAYTVTTTLPNPAGARPLRDVTLSLSVPAGWTAQATSPATFPTVAAGQTAGTTWQVGVPATAQPGKFEVSAQATFTSADGPGTSADATTVLLPHPPYPSLAAAYNNVGISDDVDPGGGNFDGGNASFSAQALAAATPSLTPGATFTHDGLTFTWPDAKPGSPDNVVAGGVAGGQTITLSGSGHTLGLIGAGDYGSPSGTATVTYTDGTTESRSVSFADWWANAATGGDILTTLPYLNNSGGQLTQPVSLYYAPIPLQPGKTVRSLTLPDVSDGANSGTAAMHIFTVAIG